MTEFFIKPRFESDFELRIPAFAIPKITAYEPLAGENDFEWKQLLGLTLADPYFLQTAKIDLLVSLVVHAQVIEGSIRKTDEGKLLATETKLGWVISGLLGDTKFSVTPTVLHVAMAERLDLLLEKFYKQEELSELPAQLIEEEQECEAHFQGTYSRNKEGRYTVRLPFKTAMRDVRLGDSINPCETMLLGLERRFAKNEKLKLAYTEFMRDYEKLGPMKRAVDNSYDSKPNSNFLTHHGVIKEDSTTTRLRTVFNGFFTTNSGYSLNKLLHAGAKDPDQLLM